MYHSPLKLEEINVKKTLLQREYEARLEQVRSLADGARKTGNRNDLVMLYHMRAQAKDAMRPCVIDRARRDLGADFDQHEGAEGRLFSWYVIHGRAGTHVGEYTGRSAKELTLEERGAAVLHQIRHILTVRPFEILIAHTPTPTLSLTRLLF